MKSDIYRQRRAKKRIITPYKRACYIITCLIIVALVIVIPSIVNAQKTQPENVISTDAEALTDVIVPESYESELIQYTGFNLSFNAENHVPNYVAWVLTADKAAGNLPRESRFAADPRVDGCPGLDDYRRSGFDRGHMAPAADMKWSSQAMADCHFLTNICPQDHSLNSGRWSTLETKCRNWATRDSVIVIVAGPILTDVRPRQIGRTRVTVPERFFKVVLAPNANPPRAIGFIMPNSYVSENLDELVYPVDYIEEITGFDFFHNLPDEIEQQVESNANYRDWNRRIRK